MRDTAGQFQHDKYVVLRSLVQGRLLASCYKYVVRIGESAARFRHDRMVPGTPSAYCDPMMDMLLGNLAPEMERATGLRLYPTFSYFRVYKRGDGLPKHRDRPACEISLSLSLGGQAEHPWPLCIEGPEGPCAVRLDPGDGLLYRGLECFHWREPFQGDFAVQVFLHYVEQDGPYAEWKFDKRPALNSFLAARRAS